MIHNRLQRDFLSCSSAFSLPHVPFLVPFLSLKPPSLCLSKGIMSPKSSIFSKQMNCALRETSFPSEPKWVYAPKESPEALHRELHLKIEL